MVAIGIETRRQLRIRRPFPKMCAGLICTVIVAFECGASADEQAEPTRAPAGALSEGWERKVEFIAAPRLNLPPGEQPARALLKIRVEKGWVVASRETAAGDLEWQVVVARSSDPVEPEVIVDPDHGVLEVKYRGYFVRESATGARLRIYREPKTDKSPEWPVVEFKQPKSPSRTGGSIDGWNVDHWKWVEGVQRIGDPADVSVRLRPYTRRVYFRGESPGGSGVFSVRGGPMEMWFGESHVVSEPDLFMVIDRITPDHAERGVPGASLRRWFEDNGHTGEAQPITGRAGVTAEAGPLLIHDRLKGRITLLGFLSIENDASIKQFPRLQQLHEKFGPRGVSVLAVHVARAPDRDDDLREFLSKQKVTLPVIIDRGEARARTPFVEGDTARRYLVDVLPTFFLIDKGGNINLGYGMAPPTDAQVEEVLSMPVGEIAPGLDARRWLNVEQPLVLEKLRGKVVLLAFRDSTVTRRGAAPLRIDPLETLKNELVGKDFVVIGVQRSADDARVNENVQQRGVTFPVLVDAGETVKRYVVKDAPEYVLIDKGGRVFAWERRILPTAADITRLLNAQQMPE